MPGTPDPDPFTIPPPPAEPILSRRTPPPPPSEPPGPAPTQSGRSMEEDNALRHFALALALVFAPAAVLLSLAILPGP